MGSSYREASEKYKDDKKKLIDGYNDALYKKIKKNKKKNKRSKHKHKYIPAIYNMSYKRIDGKLEHHQTCGQHCKICGRVKDMYYLWFNTDDRLNKFKKQNPDWIELTLPDGWDYFKDKNIPV